MVTRNELIDVFGDATLGAAFITTVAVILSSTYNGITLGEYSVTVFTNNYGENYIELFAVIISIPVLLLKFKQKYWNVKPIG